MKSVPGGSSTYKHRLATEPQLMPGIVIPDRDCPVSRLRDIEVEENKELFNRLDLHPTLR